VKLLKLVVIVGVIAMVCLSIAIWLAMNDLAIVAGMVLGLLGAFVVAIKRRTRGQR
jgi:protein-S-isoprenylcysteine O-methyltransferase Ste14